WSFIFTLSSFWTELSLRLHPRFVLVFVWLRCGFFFLCLRNWAAIFEVCEFASVFTATLPQFFSYCDDVRFQKNPIPKKKCQSIEYVSRLPSSEKMRVRSINLADIGSCCVCGVPLDE